jgi:lysophospholipase L1-like esterase
MTQLETSLNLFNKDSADIAVGKYVNPDNGALTTSASYNASHLIPVVNGVTYSFPAYYSLLAAKACKVAMYNSVGTYVASVTGTLDTGNLHGTITINNANAVYVRVTVKKTDMASDAFMFIAAAAYPTTYVHYLNQTTIPDVKISTDTKEYLNPLHGKTLVCDGDSICYGNGDTPVDGLIGYCARIGAKNSMSWKNEGISSAMIAYTESRHCVSRNVANLRADADYIIFEGGTNDADILGVGNAGSLSAGYVATLDDTIFSEAMESMLKQAILRFPGKKIGYLVAHKMGGDDAAANRRTYFDVAISACVKWGIPYLDLWNGCHLNYDISEIASVYYSDGLQHLTTAGYDYLSPIIEAWMKTL